MFFSFLSLSGPVLFVYHHLPSSKQIWKASQASAPPNTLLAIHAIICQEHNYLPDVICN